MSTTEDVDVVALETVTTKIAASVASVEFDQWTLVTPCSDWDLTALIDHIVGGNWFTIAVLAGERAEDAMTATMEKFGDRSATGEAAIESLNDQVVAFLGPEVLDRTWNHVAGDISGRQILRLRLHDLIVHSWDIDESLHPGAALPDRLIRWGLDELAADDSLTAQHFDLGNNMPVPRSPNDGSTTYLAVFGR